MNTAAAHRGFTLIELMVSMGLFAFVITIASGAYLLMIGLNQQAEGLASGSNNLAFALETMTREIRTGTAYSSPSSSSFSFTDDNKCNVTYSLSGTTIVQTIIGTNCISQTTAPLITDPTVQVSALTFSLTGTGVNDKLQPHVTVLVSGTVTSGKKVQSFVIETGATQRSIDL